MEDCSRQFEASATNLTPKATGCCSAVFMFVCLSGSIVQSPTTWAEDSATVQVAVPATVVSRTAQSHSATVHQRVRYDQNFDGWIIRNPGQPVTEDFVQNSEWEIVGSGDVLSARRNGDKEFRIYHRTWQSVFRFRCLGSDASSSGSLRRFAYLRDSNAWISHQPLFPEDRSATPFTGEASTLLDRNVDAIAWTADGRHIVYCRHAKFPKAQSPNSISTPTDAFRSVSKGEYELVAYSLADDDYTVLLTFAATKVRPVMGRDSKDGFYLVTNGSIIRQISLPVDVTRFAFDGLEQIPVLHRTTGSTVDSIHDDLDGRIHVLETDSNAGEYETILAVESDSSSDAPSAQR